VVVSSTSSVDFALPKFEVNFIMLESSVGDSKSIERQVYIAFGISIVSTDFGILDLSTNLGI
jgi:hypothetical protein